MNTRRIMPSKFTFSLSKKLGIASAPTANNPGRLDARGRREQAIIDKLSRFALIPATEIFNLRPDWSPQGLSDEAARAARDVHGVNTPTNGHSTKPLVLLFSAVINPFNILLCVLASISIGTGDKATFGVMLVMVLASTGLRFWQEVKSMSKATALINSVTTRVHVLRPCAGSSSAEPTSDEIEIDRKQIVPGDVLAVSSGDVFPGDCVVISASALTVSQASLTGELMPVEKTVRIVAAGAQQRFDLLHNDNVCLSGTSVTTGNAYALVILTGKDTYMASIAKEMEKSRPLNAMQLGIRKVSFILFAFMMVMAPTVLIIQGLVHKNWKNALLFSLAVAVGITPEMLPMIVASNLALSAVRVARKKVIVKRFDAIQNLGAVSILCSDKTGTLTTDCVRVYSSTTHTGAVSDLPVKIAYINSSMQVGTRSPIDSAIIDYVHGQSLEGVDTDDWVKLGEIPFDSSRRLLSVLVLRRSAGEDSSLVHRALLITKGAVEEVLDSCTRILTATDIESSLPHLDPNAPAISSPLTTEARQQILRTADRLNGDGQRLVAVACKLTSAESLPVAGSSSVKIAPLSADDEDDLMFIGFLGFLDPPKPDAKEAITRLRELNIRVKILTGDSPAISAKIGRDIGILDPLQTTTHDLEQGHITIEMQKRANDEDLIVTGSQLASLTAAENRAELRNAVERGVIFAKLSPYQKLQVVEILRAGQKWVGGTKAVAFLGDGVNDALAIRGADVGISVDSGTEIAKEAADVILLERNLNVVADGVIQGRRTFINTIKYVKMAASSNFGNVASVLVASAWLPYEPMLALQLLTQNLLYDFSQGSIPWDNVDPEYLLRPVSWNAMSIVRFMLCIGPLSSPWDILTFTLNWFRYGIRSANSPLVPRAQGHWFIEGAVTQLLIIHFLRTPKLPFIRSRASTIVVLVTTGMAMIALAIPWIPSVNTALKFEHPVGEFYGFLAVFVVGYALLVHVAKTIYIRVFKEWL